MSRLDDTIVAVSSPPGRSTRGLIRLSGQRAFHIVDAITLAPPGEPTDAQGKQATRQLLPATLVLPADDTPISLPILLSRFIGPRSYTGQDMVEMQCPGNPALLERMVQAAIAQGARLADPGEFTFRAYTHGKLDLTQAEGIAATISATSDSELEAARLLREGRLGRFAHEIVERLANHLALVEAGIDFTDQEDVVPIGPGPLHDRLTQLDADLDDLLRNSRAWGAIEALPRVVLVGAPSVGKSTLFNALLDRDRAVIRSAPGTTRDVLAEPLTLDDAMGRPVEVMLLDIAGLDEATHLLDRAAQSAAQQAIERADLLLMLDDGQSKVARDATAAPSLPRLAVRTKADEPATDASDTSHAATSSGDTVRVSAHTGEGLPALRRAIIDRLADRAVSVSADMLALQPRHDTALRSAREHLSEAAGCLTPQRDGAQLHHVELIAAAMRAALDDLAGLGGEMTPDDVIGRVFATFCVGK